MAADTQTLSLVQHKIGSLRKLICNRLRFKSIFALEQQTAMIYSNKKVNQKGNLAQQTAQIITNVATLSNKNLIRLEEDTVYLYPELWKDKASAINWINCLHHYYVVKRQFKNSAPLYFKNIVTEELIGSMVNKKAKVVGAWSI